MGHSLQSVGDSRKWFNDLDLLLTTRIMVESFDQEPERFGRLAAIVDLWRQIPHAHGPGTIDLQLSELVSMPVAAPEFVELTHRSERLIERAGDPIPAGVANGRWRVPGVKFSDYESSRLVDTLARLRGLLPR